MGHGTRTVDQARIASVSIRLRAKTGRSPRSQVATGSTTSLARAGDPSEGERRVLESVATHVLAPTARAGGPIRTAQRAPRRAGAYEWLPPPAAQQARSARPAQRMATPGVGRTRKSRRHIPPVPRSSARGGVNATDRPIVEDAPTPWSGRASLVPGPGGGVLPPSLSSKSEPMSGTPRKPPKNPNPPRRPKPVTPKPPTKP